MIEIWMKNHLVSESICNIVNLLSFKKLQGMINNDGVTFSIGETIPRFTISIEQDKLELLTLNIIFSVLQPTHSFL
jgi:hypothetical protein